MNSLRTAKRFVFPLLGLWVLLYASFSLKKPPLLDGIDSVQAEAAREMAVSGDWITPHVNGVRTFAVSPLVTWTTAASFRVFGVSDWAARLPLALLALWLFLLTLSLGSRLFLTPIAGFYAALILLTSGGVFLFGHLLYPAVPFTLFLTGAIYSFWRSLRLPSLGTAIGFALACALGMLTQGIYGVLLPVAIVVAFLAITKNLRHLLRWHPVIGILVFLVVSLPWPIALHMRNSGGAWGWITHNQMPLLLFWAFLFLWILPWCIFSVASIAGFAPARSNVRSNYVQPHEDKHHGHLLLIVWLVAVVAVFSFFERQEFMLVPALPAMALLAAGWLAADEAENRTAPSRLARTLAWIFFFGGLAVAIFAAVLCIRVPWQSSGTDIATLVRLHAGSHTLFFGHLRDLTTASVALFRIPLLIAAAALAAGVTANLIFRLKNKARLANCFLAGMMVFILIAAHIALNTFSPVISSAVLAEAIKPEVDAADIVVVQGQYEDASALGFYLEKRLHLFTPDGSGTLAQGNEASTVLENADSLARLWNGQGRVFLWTTPASVPSLPGAVYVVGSDGGHEIVSNQPNNGGAAF
jgi:Dolichyl-phosphate-mannose-protein mannosyltransferase